MKAKVTTTSTKVRSYATTNDGGVENTGYAIRSHAVVTISGDAADLAGVFSDYGIGGEVIEALYNA
jgi:hypothetical protein